MRVESATWVALQQSSTAELRPTVHSAPTHSAQSSLPQQSSASWNRATNQSISGL